MTNILWLDDFNFKNSILAKLNLVAVRSICKFRIVLVTFGYTFNLNRIY